jgi:hypothetical protein
VYRWSLDVIDFGDPALSEVGLLQRVDGLSRTDVKIELTRQLSPVGDT